MAKKQHISRIDAVLQSDIEKFKMESSQPTAELPTAQIVNESVERLTTTTTAPKPKEKAASTVGTGKKKPKIQKDEIARGRDARGELNRVGTTVLFDRDLLQRVKIHAVKTGLSMSDIVNDALNKYLSV